MSAALEATLRTGAQALALELSEAQIAQLQRFKQCVHGACLSCRFAGVRRRAQRTRILGAGVPRRMVTRNCSSGAGGATSGKVSLSVRCAQNSFQLGNSSWKVPL